MHQVIQPSLDTTCFYSALLSKKERLGVTWKSICQQMDLSDRCIQDLFAGRISDWSEMERLGQWLDTPVQQFMSVQATQRRLRREAQSAQYDLARPLLPADEVIIQQMLEQAAAQLDTPPAA